MEYVPLTLSDFKAGLYVAREPWLCPKETFRVLENGIVFNGRAQCRPGYTPFASLVTVLDSVLTTSTGTTFSGTAPGPYPYNISKGGVRITHASVTTMHDRDGNGILYLEGGASVGTINYTNGAVSWTAAGVASGNRTLSHRKAVGAPVTGLSFFTPKQGGTYIVASDTTSVYLYNPLTHTFEAIGSPVFTGGSNDLVQMVPFDDQLLLSNGVNKPYKFVPPATVVAMSTDFDGDLVDDIDAVQFLLRHRNRLLYCGTTENGVVHPGRVRRSAQGDPEVFDTALDASDAPTNRDIVSGGLLGDTVVLQFSGAETWAYRYTGDLSQPYEWVPVSATSGGSARLGTIRGERTLYTISLDGVHESDGLVNQNIDEQIEGAVQGFLDPTNVALSVGIYNPVDDFVYWCGPEVGESQPTRTLVFDAKRKIWSTYTYGMRALALQVEPIAKIWDELTGNADALVGTADGLGAQPGGTQIYGGDEFGVIHKLNLGSTDAGGLVDFTVRTQLVAPFGPTAESRFGWVDVVMDRADGKTATVSLYREYDSLAYVSQSVSLTGEGGNTKVRRRVRAGQIARYHQVEVRIPNAAPSLGVDLIELHVSPARGGMRLL